MFLLLAVLPASGLSTSCAGNCGLYLGTCGCDDACFTLFNDCCPDAYQTCFQPDVTSVEPSPAPTTGNTILTITGQNLTRYGNNLSTVMIDGIPCPLLSNPVSTALRCTVPEGQGAGLDLVVRHAGPLGNTGDPFIFNYAAPTLLDVTPASRPTSGGILLTLTGSNFGTSSVVTVNNIGCPVIEQGHNLLKCNLPAGQGGNVDLVVAADNQQATVPFAYDAPELTQIVPANSPASGGTAMTLTGSNFGTASVVRIGGTPCPILSQGHSTLHCQIPAGVGTDLPVTVEAGNQFSNSRSFSYTGLAVNSITPTSGPTAGNIPLTITGSGFTPGDTATVAGNACSVTSTSATQIVCTLPAGQGTNAEVRVANVAQVSNPALFDYEAPAIGSISASSSSTAGGGVLTINGTNFGTTPSASVGTSSCPVLPGSTHTRVLCTIPAGEGVDLPVRVTVAGQTSNEELFDYGAPVLLSIFPTSGTTAGNIPLTINGTNFGLTASVSVDGVNCPVTSRGHTQLVCTLPAGTGSNVAVVATVLDRPSNAGLFSYTGAHILSIVPQNGPSSGNIPLTINGSSFTPSDTVTVGGTACSVGSQNSVRLICNLPAGQGAARPVVVTSGGVPSNTAIFDYDAPLITGVESSSAPTAGGVLLTINGSSFGTSGTVSVDNQACPVTSYGHTSIQCNLPAGQGAGVDVKVTSASRVSIGFPFSYTGPVISSIFPTGGTAAGNIPLTINGTNFGTSSAVTVAGRSCPVTQQGHTSLVCTLPAGEGATAPVRVAAGNQTSNTRSFAYTPPVLSGVSPTSGPTAGGIPLTLTGTNFGAANIVTVNGVDCPVTQQSSTTVVCTLPEGQGVSQEVRLAAGDQPSGPVLFSYEAPAISEVIPASGPTSGNIPITIAGTNFGTTGSITVGGNSCVATLHDHSRIVCTLPAGTAGVQTVAVAVAGQSDTANFTYEDPTPTATPTATETPTVTGTATPTPLCEPTPRASCRAAGKSVLSLRDDVDDSKDKLSWSWSKGEATALGDLGDPQATTDYRFCLYDGSGPVLELRVAPGGTCSRGKPCWKTDKSPFTYADSEGSAFGVTKLQAKAAEAGKSSVKLRGKGTELPDVTLPLTTPVTAQVINGDGTCWSATYAGPAATAESDAFKISYTAP